jgi:hypothetical protein
MADIENTGPLVEIEDLDLSKPEDQAKLLERIQRILASERLDKTTQSQLNLLKTTIKIKYDLDFLQLFKKLEERITKLETKKDEKDTIPP